MLKIEFLTEEQKNRLSEFRDKWIKIGLSTEPANREEAERGIRMAYKIAGLDSPKIIWCLSPKAVFLTMNAEETGGSVHPKVINSIRAQARMSVYVRKGYDVTMATNVKYQRIYYDIEVITGAIQIPIWSFLKTSFGNHTYSPVFGQDNAYWLALYDYLRNVFNLEKETEKLKGLSSIAKNCGWIFPYKKICWATERHNVLFRDNEGRLHADGRMACAYPDGWGLYAWHGTTMPKKYGSVKSNNWKPEWILQEKNAEVRKCLIEGIGYEKMLRKLKAKKMSIYGKYTLYRIDDKVDIEPVLLLNMICPSTGSNYCLRVPPDIETAEQAINWCNHDIKDFVVET